MSLKVHQFACLDDNYGFLIRDEATGKVGCIDTPDGDAVIAAAKQVGWTIDVVFNTHWHPDHAGGNEAVKARFGSHLVGPAEVQEHFPVDQIVKHGETVMLGETAFEVIDTGGHTLGHVCYYSAGTQKVFVGDTLFPLGCGRVFEGTFEQMWNSLSRLAALPADTVVYSAHEYTLGNARFAASVDSSAELAARIRQVERTRERGQPTVPTTIGEELATNPFLRAPLLSSAGNEVDAFAEIRAAKDNFRG
jgi:hydroxyacylglutathione hydrolase